MERLLVINKYVWWWGSSVNIMTRPQTGWPGFNFQRGQDPDELGISPKLPSNSNCVWSSQILTTRLHLMLRLKMCVDCTVLYKNFNKTLQYNTLLKPVQPLESYYMQMTNEHLCKFICKWAKNYHILVPHNLFHHFLIRWCFSIFSV